MSTVAELENRCEHLESLLRERDRKDAEARAETQAKQQATDDAAQQAALAEAAGKEREVIRRGAWVSVLLGVAPKDGPVDLAALDASIPKEGWPESMPEDRFVFRGGVVPKEKQVDASTTFLGKTLASLTPIKP